MIVEILDQLGKTNLDREKLQILKENADNKPFIKMLQVVYNQKFNLGITDVQLPTVYGSENIDNNIDKLDPLLNAEITGNAAEDYLNNLISTLTEDNAKVLQKIVRKNLQVGVGVKTINSAIANLIPKPPYMRCALYSEKTKNKINFPCYIQRKMDGQFCNMIIDSTRITFLSRSGTEYYFNRDFTKLHNDLYTKYGECVIMGELLYKVNNEIQPREIGNGVINKASESNKTITFEESAGICLVAWDVVSLDEYKQEKTNVNYRLRFNTVIDISEHSDGFIDVVETKIANNMDEVYNYYQDVISDAEAEGIIIKNFTNPWANKTSQEQLKLKCKFQVELRIIGFKPGKSGTFIENSLGALTVESSDSQLITDVGTGLDEKTRNEIWQNQNKYLGKIVTVEAHRTMKKDDKYSLILPVFIEIREDKTEADDLKTVLEQETAARQ